MPAPTWDAEIRARLPLIEEFIGKHLPYGVERDDLEQEGMIAIWLGLVAGESDEEIRERVGRRISLWHKTISRQQGGRRPIDPQDEPDDGPQPED